MSGDNNVEDIRRENQDLLSSSLNLSTWGYCKGVSSKKEIELTFPAVIQANLQKIATSLLLSSTQSIALNLYRLSRRDVYINITLVHRRFVDFNREPECAFEPSNDHLAEHLYDEYHNGIKKIIKKMHNQSNQGLCFLFDIHGTGKRMPTSILELTVQTLLDPLSVDCWNVILMHYGTIMV